MEQAGRWAGARWGCSVLAAALSIAATLHSESPNSVRQMMDGKHWTTANLNVNSAASYCYGGSETNCHAYGRLYTWESARSACRSLGTAWRLPTNEDWQRMAGTYGGVRGDAADGGEGAYSALFAGGKSGFNAVLGGGRVDGKYARLDAHGFYWTDSESKPGRVWFYNFGKGMRILNRHGDGDKQWALSVRCIRD